MGTHVRHIIDHYHSVKSGFISKVVDYELRKRGSLAETNRHVSLAQLAAIQVWIKSLTEVSLDETITVRSDVGIDSCHIIEVKSTLARELMFACSHAVHHYAALKHAYQLLGGKSDDIDFGLASSTATFYKQQCEIS